MIQAFFASKATDKVVTIPPSGGSKTNIRKKHPDLTIVPLKMRLLKYEVSGSTVCLGTMLLDLSQ